jgi:hypothetical protein
MALDLCGHQISVTCTFTSPASEAPPIWRRERGCATHRRNVFHLMFAYGVRQRGEGLACVPNIGATFFRLLFFFFGVSPMRRRTAMVAKYRHHVFPPHLITALSLYCFRGSANMAPDLCGRQTLAACISTSPASEAPPIWRQECGCAIHRRSVFHLAFAYGVRRRGEGLACVPNIGATFFRLLLFLTGFADVARDLRACQTSVPRSSASCYSLRGSAHTAMDLRGCQMSASHISTPPSCSEASPIWRRTCVSATYWCHALPPRLVPYGVSPIWLRTCVVSKHWCHVLPPLRLQGYTYMVSDLRWRRTSAPYMSTSSSSPTGSFNMESLRCR